MKLRFLHQRPGLLRAVCPLLSLGLLLWSLLAGVRVSAQDSAPHSAPGLVPVLEAAPDSPAVEGPGVEADSVTVPTMTLPSGFRTDRQVIGLPIDLPHDGTTKDPIFALLIGLVDTDIYGTVTQSRLQHHLDKLGLSSKLPYKDVERVTRLPGERNHTAIVEVNFRDQLRLPIPYSILGYNPGSFTASRHCVFAEYQLGRVLVRHYESPGDSSNVVDLVLEDVHLYGLKEGTLFLDIDGWVDRLLGGSIDDTELVGVMLCKFNGEWHGFAMGYNKDKKGRSGALNFREDKVVFPTPREVKTIGRRMRAKVENMMRIWPVAEMARE